LTLVRFSLSQVGTLVLFTVHEQSDAFTQIIVDNEGWVSSRFVRLLSRERPQVHGDALFFRGRDRGYRYFTSSLECSGDWKAQVIITRITSGIEEFFDEIIRPLYPRSRLNIFRSSFEIVTESAVPELCLIDEGEEI